MSWKIKLNLLIKAGISREDAMIKLLDDYAESNKAMDLKLAKCINYLSAEQIQEIFGSGY